MEFRPHILVVRIVTTTLFFALAASSPGQSFYPSSQVRNWSTANTSPYQTPSYQPYRSSRTLWNDGSYRMAAAPTELGVLTSNVNRDGYVGPTNYQPTPLPAVGQPQVETLPGNPQHQGTLAEPQPQPDITYQGVSDSLGCCTGCNDCCCNCCCPCWMITVDAIAMKRSDPPSNPIIINETTQVRIFDAQNLDHDYEIGPRVRILKNRGPCCCSIEAGYFGIYNWNSSATVTGDVRFVGPGFQIAVNPGSFTMDYESRLQSGELNFRPGGRGNPWGWFFGLRYINLEETFSVRENNTPLPNVLRIDTLNNLYGGQIGTQFVMFGIGRPLTVQGRITGGVYYNDASQGTSSAIVGPGVTASTEDVAFVGEAELSIVYQLTRCWGIRAGYQIMGISGVALAPDQIHSTHLNVSQASVRLNTLWLDGAHVGLVCLW